MRVYVSGSITGRPLDAARKTFADAAAALAALGYEPVNPMDLPTDPDCACPNAAGTDGTGSGHDWACYLRKDIRAVVDCQAILMLPGWEASHGARLELTVASAIGLRVWWQMPAAPKLAQGGIIRRDQAAIVGEQPDGCVVPAERPIDLDDRAPRPTHSTKFQSAIAGRPLDLVSFTAGSGRQYEGERSDTCPGDGIPGHRHYIGCIRPPSPPKPPAGRPQTVA